MFASLLRLILLICSCAAFTASAQDAAQEAGEDIDQIDFYLHTVDVGNLIFNNFGHTALRVHNKNTGSDLVFNWGIFDFNDPLSFSLRFYRGYLVYNLGIYPYTRAIRSYEDEGRTVWEDKLEFTREEKQRLLKKLIWNAEKKNRAYDYQYFFDNCSTRPRDYFDEALDGQLKRATSSELTPSTFREMMYQGYSYNPGMDVLLDVGMNNRLDYPISQWQRMFHPIALREVLLQTPINGRSLIKESRILTQHPTPTSYENLGYLIMFLGTAVPLTLVVLLLYFRDKLPFSSKLLYRLFALIALPLCSFGAFVGFMMPMSWAVSTHLDLHHNANQLLFWPLDFLIWGLLLGILIKGRPLRLKDRNWRLLRTYGTAHLLVSLLLPILRALDLIQQDVDRAVVYLLPPYLAILLLVLRVGVNKDEAATPHGTPQ